MTTEKAKSAALAVAINVISAQIADRRQRYHDDINYYATHYVDSARLIDMRSRLWAVELTMLDRAREDLCR